MPQSLVRPQADGQWYLGEDYAFCERVRRAGYKILADSTIRLRHYGSYGYTWEDARFDFHFPESNEE